MLSRFVNLFRRNKAVLECPICGDKKYFLSRKKYEDAMVEMADIVRDTAESLNNKEVYSSTAENAVAVGEASEDVNKGDLLEIKV